MLKFFIELCKFHERIFFFFFLFASFWEKTDACVLFGILFPCIYAMCVYVFIDFDSFRRRKPSFCDNIFDHALHFDRIFRPNMKNLHHSSHITDLFGNPSQLSTHIDSLPYRRVRSLNLTIHINKFHINSLMRMTFLIGISTSSSWY